MVKKKYKSIKDKKILHDEVIKNKYRTYSADQNKNVLATLKAISKSCSKLLIVPGTIFWLESISSRGPFRDASLRAHNSCPIFYNGNCFVYNKHRDAVEISREEREQGISFHTGDKNGNFSFKGIRGVKFGIEICADHNNCELKKACIGSPVDIQLITSCGAKPLKDSIAVKPNGHVIHSDGACTNAQQIWRKGVYKLQDTGLQAVLPKGNFDETWSSVYQIEV